MKNEVNLFTAALGLNPPWEASKVDFNPEEGRLDIYISRERGSKHPCLICAVECNVHDTQARKDLDLSQVERVGIDETSSRRGHNYVSVFVDLDQAKVIYVTEGKDAKTVKSFKDDLRKHNGKPQKVLDFCCDMSPAFIKGVEENFPRAAITFDRFHVMKIVNQAVDAAEVYLKRWYFWATHSRLEPIKEVAYTIKRHWAGIIEYIKSRINNGILEGINSLIQATKSKARGYRNVNNLITIIYLTCGKLKIDLPRAFL